MSNLNRLDAEALVKKANLEKPGLMSGRDREVATFYLLHALVQALLAIEDQLDDLNLHVRDHA